jgi:hypothetical protein
MSIIVGETSNWFEILCFISFLMFSIPLEKIINGIEISFKYVEFV